MTLTFGRVPHPPYVDRLILDRDNGAWDNLGQRQVLGCRWHRMIGSLGGTDGWFRRGAAANGLTDYGIGCLATDGVALAGVIYRWNDPTGRSYPGVSPNRSPWASGPYSSACAFGDGRKNVADRGVNAVNRDGVSIEISGNYETPLDDACRDSLVKLTAYWADQGKVPWDQFPTDPRVGYSYVKWHTEYCGDPATCAGGEKPCPGRVVRDETPALLAQVATYLKSFQTQGATPDEEDPLADVPKSKAVINSEDLWPNYGGGKVSQAWADYGSRTGIFNPPGQPWGDLDQTGKLKIYCFDGGPCFDEQGNLVVKVK